MLRVDTQSGLEIAMFSCRGRLRDGSIVRKVVPIVRADASGLPPSVAGIVAMFDIQGVGGSLEAPRLAAFDAVDAVVVLGLDGKLPLADRLVAVLAGDLFAVQDVHERGADGDDSVARPFAFQRARTISPGSGSPPISSRS